jgi:[ribosomal protein S18]-alanine N-acetyltransferase
MCRTNFIQPMLNLRWLRKRASFKLPRRKQPLPACRMRLIEEADYAACEEIFLLNEPVHFPPARYGAFDLFKAWLRQQESLIVVAEHGGLVCGLGGIAVDYVPAEDRRIAWLGFGMVHPDHHGHGIGTALLMCRLSLLPAGHLPMTVCMQSAGASYRFYKRFGFRRFASAKLAEELPLDLYHVPITREDRVFCEDGLAADQVDRTLLIGAKSGRFKALDPPVPTENPMPG